MTREEALKRELDTYKKMYETERKRHAFSVAFLGFCMGVNCFLFWLSTGGTP